MLSRLSGRFIVSGLCIVSLWSLGFHWQTNFSVAPQSRNTSNLVAYDNSADAIRVNRGSLSPRPSSVFYRFDRFENRQEAIATMPS